MGVRKSDNEPALSQVVEEQLRRAAKQAIELATQSLATDKPAFATVDGISLAVEPTGAIEPASRNERFTSGRAALQRAASGAGVELGQIGRDAERGAPLLPDGLAGSISHTRGVSIAVASSATARALGLDLERCIPERPRLEKRVLTPFERQNLGDLAGARRWRAVLAVFCAKEAAFKALDRIVAGPPLTFRSLEVSLASDALSIVRVSATPEIRAHVAVEQNDELTVGLALSES